METENAYKVIGFDIRQGPIVTLDSAPNDFCRWPVGDQASAPYLPTISQNIWPRSSKCERIDHPDTNGINLLWLPDALAMDLRAFNVAFSLRSTRAGILEEKLSLLLIDETFLRPSLGWKLLGYDVVDAWLSRSIFYNFGIFPDAFASVFSDVTLGFNERGLLDDENVAEAVARRLASDVVSDYHSPFHPLRVWIQAPKLPV